MNKQEFLEQMRTALSGEVSPAVIQENMSYYDSYISEEMRKGRSEQEVMDELGDPRLIARTIIDTSGGGFGPSQQTYYEEQPRQSGDYQENYGGFGQESWGRQEEVRKRPWYQTVLTIALVVIIIGLVISLITGVVSILAPIAIPALLVLIIYRLIRGNQR